MVDDYYCSTYGRPIYEAHNCYVCGNRIKVPLNTPFEDRFEEAKKFFIRMMKSGRSPEYIYLCSKNCRDRYIEKLKDNYWLKK